MLKKKQRLCEKYTNNETHKVTMHWYKSLTINERKMKRTFTWHHFTTYSKSDTMLGDSKTELKRPGRDQLFYRIG